MARATPPLAGGDLRLCSECNNRTLALQVSGNALGRPAVAATHRSTSAWGTGPRPRPRGRPASPSLTGGLRWGRSSTWTATMGACGEFCRPGNSKRYGAQGPSATSPRVQYWAKSAHAPCPGPGIAPQRARGGTSGEPGQPRCGPLWLLASCVAKSPPSRQRCLSPLSDPRSLALETRTTAKDSHEVTEQRFLFDASAGRRFSVGALASNDVVVTDPNVQAKQAFLE